jgi:cytochrome P450
LPDRTSGSRLESSGWREADVQWSEQFGGWVVTGHDEIGVALKAPGLTAARMVGQLDMLPVEQRDQIRPLRDSVAQWMGHTNQVDHLRMQRVIKRYFSPATVERLRPRVQALTDELIDGVEARGGCEVVAELARPLPARVIAEMLGVPPADRDLLPAWSRDIGAVFGPVDLPSLLRSQRSVVEMSDYLRPVVAARRAEPTDDLISMLVAAQEQGTVRDTDEIVANCVLLLFAGHETTAGLIANGLHLLLTHPDQLELLRATPELLPAAVEEMLRYAGPAGAITRLAVQPTELCGHSVEPGQVLLAALGAGNRDPGLCPAPEVFDVTRDAVRHLAFGQGTFYCLGAPLARVEAQVFFATALRRLPGLRLHPDGPEWGEAKLLSTRMERLPVTF